MRAPERISRSAARAATPAAITKSAAVATRQTRGRRRTVKCLRVFMVFVRSVLGAAATRLRRLLNSLSMMSSAPIDVAGLVGHKNIGHGRK
jgi:hypothetical protein